MPSSRELFCKFPNRYFVETGSFCGDGIQNALDANFASITSIELAEHYYKCCCQRFANDHRVSLVLGNSSFILWDLIKNFDAPITFWLDGHYSGGDTVKGVSNTPILTELSIIARHPIKTHAILIDDIRCFGTDIFDDIELDHIIKLILQINPKYQIDLCDGWQPKDILTASIS
jgi:hypothetical protein